MIVHFIPYIGGVLADNKTVPLGTVPDYMAYETAHKFYEDKEYVEKMLDGRGWITMMIPGNHGIIRYMQEATHK